MNQLARAGPQVKLADLDTVTPEDRQAIWTWNCEAPAAVERCIHDLFAEQAGARPDAPAICAWDGEMTYGELDELSTKLAGHLIELGVKPDDIVPLCFEKSMWAIVGMLAVLKAGGAFVPLDSNHPESRYRDVFKQIGSQVVLTSGSHFMPWRSSRPAVVAVNKSTLARLPIRVHRIHSAVEPRNLAYVIFTSGSTGQPKGVMMQHRAFSTGCLIHGRALGFMPESRVLQFASYTFDASVQEIITTLIHGGCVCVPSDNDRRSDLANAINHMDVNYAILTSSVARSLDPGIVPSLRVLVLVGEQVSFDDWARWDDRVRKINGYGPAECCIVCTAYLDPQSFKSATIGKSIASVTWVVDPEDHHILAPMGSVGELLVEGPILARGYLNDPETTSAAFIAAPAWLSAGGAGVPGRHGRLYKTGDLVRYDAAGNLVYIGRKDTQVKVRGQRVELGEIEHHLRECLPEAKQVVVETISPKGGSGSAAVAAFLHWGDEGADTNGSPARVVFPSGIDERLAERLPSYMVPGVYFAVGAMPMTASGKTDRKRLREIGASFSAQQLAEMRTSGQEQKRTPSTETERTMQQLWGQVLKIAPESIGLDDSFFRLGGDSIAAMKLVGEAGKHGIRLTVADAFRHPKLSQLVCALQPPAIWATPSIPPFSLLPRDIEKTFLTGLDSSINEIEAESIIDILPVTHLQKTYVDQGINFPRLAFNYFYLDIGPHLDVDLLEDSCRRLVRHFAILRTRFSYLDGRLWQVVLRDPETPFNTYHVDGGLSEESHAFCMLDIERTNPLGLPTSFTLLRRGARESRLIVRLSHAQYDGVCLQLVLKTLVSIYQQEPLRPTTDFAAYIAHAAYQQGASSHHWRVLLRGASLTRATARLCSLAPEEPILRAIKVERSIDAPTLPAHFTMASLIGSAWAVVLSTISGEDDIVYGQVTAGRNSDIPGISEMVGPCLNIVPVRVLTPSAKTSEQLIRSVQEQYLSLGQSDSMGWDEIVQQCTDWPAESMYESVILYQNIEEEPEIYFAGTNATVQGFDNPFSIAPRLSVITQPQETKLKITIAGNTRITTIETAYYLLDMLVKAVRMLSTDLQAPLASCKSSLPAADLK
ncbi:hypothetical protein QBC35DRAFT_536599 [Podospora australis]|uniref:Carrier domain-containing protein n=1 Tax=Podospora australis TaxID=1536484 RepID=A0AAN6WJ69_9PEZI|nr:hypothetical protein QBC35DRAFT_536599 [Podospora australis]